MDVSCDIPRDPAQEVIVPADGLRQLLVQMLTRKSMFAAEAEIAAARMVEADLRGIHSHGSRAIGRYLESMDAGNIDPRAQVLTLTETPAMAVLDGGRGMGHVAATKAMELAIRKARDVGTGTVVVHRSHHYGASSVYALLAAGEGMIGHTCTSTAGASVAPVGSHKAAVANNALAWAVPTRTGTPFVLDMACAQSSWGKIETLKLYGQPMPPGWAVDAAGRETCDPAAAAVLLPAAGARGYGLAFLCSVLAGPLGGGKMPLHKKRASDVESSQHFFYAIDVAQFTDLETFYREVDSTMADIRALPPAEGFDRVRLPGEAEGERAKAWQRDGLPLHRDHVEMLTTWAAKLRLDVPWSK